MTSVEAIAYAETQVRGGASRAVAEAPRWRETPWRGLIIDTSRHFNRILSIDPAARTATVQPGVICDQLRRAAAEVRADLWSGPLDAQPCSIGGIVAKNAFGSDSVARGTAGTTWNR